jgi:hypothetical protein
MVVERDDPDAALGDPGEDFLLAVEVKGLVAQVTARVGGKPRPELFDG